MILRNTQFQKSTTKPMPLTKIMTCYTLKNLCSMIQLNIKYICYKPHICLQISIYTHNYDAKNMQQASQPKGLLTELCVSFFLGSWIGRNPPGSF